MAHRQVKNKPGRGEVIQWRGDVITEPGIYRGISLELYHSAELFGGIPAISSSGLRTIFSYSPLHYWNTSPLNPEREEPADKVAWILGRALHHLVAGESYFKDIFVLRPAEYRDDATGELKKWNGNAHACKRWIKDTAKGRQILTPEMVEQLEGMALKLGQHALVRQGILHGAVEHSYFWRDDETGIWLKWRPDTSPLHSADYVDLKTTQDVRWIKLQRAIEDYGYPQQGALGRVAVPRLLGRPMESFSLFFIESKKPHACRLVTLKDVDLELGERMNRAAMRTFWKCWKDKTWPGPAESDVEFIETSERSRERIEASLKAAGV